jgi:hypothetical protein
MAWFRCFIRGQNFPGQLIGEAGPVGFYVTRFVEAAEPEAAEAATLRGLRVEPKLAPPPGFTPTGHARVYFEQIAELAAEQVPVVQPGFTWYPMEGASAEPDASADGGRDTGSS